MIEILIASIVIMLASLSGALFIWNKLGDFLEKNLSFLVSFSAGVFLFVTFLIIEEVFHHSLQISHGIFWILLGIVFYYGLFKLLPQFHHHHDELEEHEHPHDGIDVKRILVSDGIHNVGDGIFLATSFLAGPDIGVLATFSIFIHEFVQGVSEFFVVKQAGYNNKKSLSLIFAVSGTILIGSIGSYFLFETFEMLKIPLLGIAAGSFLMVVVNDLIPHSIRHSHNKTQYAKHFMWFVIGLILMGFIGKFFGH